MKAAVMTTLGGPDVLKFQDIPDPAPPTGTDVVVRVMAAGINPADAKMRKGGTIRPPSFPVVLGFDAAGIIEAVGPATVAYKVGDRVYFCTEGLGDKPGTYAQFVTVDERYITLMPEKLSFVEAAAVPLVAITAY